MTTLTIGADDFIADGVSPSARTAFRFSLVNLGINGDRITTTTLWEVICDEDGNASTELPDPVIGNGLLVWSSAEGWEEIAIAAYPFGDDVTFSVTTARANYAVNPSTLTPIPAPAAWDAELSNLAGSVAHNSGNETITGTKTFTGALVVPTPAGSANPTTKAYVDAAVADATTTITVGDTAPDDDTPGAIYVQTTPRF